MLTENELKNNGFVRSSKPYAFEDITVWIRRISDDVFLEYDPADGFCCLERISNHKIPGRIGQGEKAQLSRIRIYIPKKIKTLHDLEKLLDAIIWSL